MIFKILDKIFGVLVGAVAGTVIEATLLGIDDSAHLRRITESERQGSYFPRIEAIAGRVYLLTVFILAGTFYLIIGLSMISNATLGLIVTGSAALIITGISYFISSRM